MAVRMHIYSAAKPFGDFGDSATKIAVLTPSALETFNNRFCYRANWGGAAVRH
jgi:hypothetical protein